jgi:hypothetical protein
MLAKPRHGEFAGRVGVQMARALVAGQWLVGDSPLQGHEGVNEGLGPRRAAGNVHVHRNITINPLEHVVALFERPARNGARPHRDDVFRLSHLIVEPHDLWRHLFCDRPGDDHQVRLPRRGAKHFRAESGEVVTRHCGGDHLDGAAGQSELQRPHGILPAPVVNLLQGRREDALFLQFAF